MMRRDRRGEMGVAVWAGLPGGPVAALAPYVSGASGGYSPAPMGVRETTALGGRKKGRIACLFVDCKGNEPLKKAIFDRLHQLFLIQTDPSRTSAEKASASAEEATLLAEYAAILEREGGCC
jgi:hypothetical protein